MKLLHRKDLFGWSEFNEERNIDFNSVLWVREGGNILIDPLPLSDHDQRHLQALGGARLIVVSNSDHCRATKQIAERTGAAIAGPRQEQEDFPLRCERWLEDNEEIVPGLTVYELGGSKTPGELALLLEDTTLITGDLIRCHRAGELCLLPEAKLSDQAKAAESVARLASRSRCSPPITELHW